MSGPDDSLRRPLDPGAEFAPALLDVWRLAAEESLEGRSLAELSVELFAGLTERPLYTAAELPAPAASVPRRTAAGWQACQRCDHPDPAETGRWIAEAALRGVGCAWLAFDAAARSGLDAWDPESAALPVDGLVLSSAS